jgi:hypothetical protein
MDSKTGQQFVRRNGRGADLAHDELNEHFVRDVGAVYALTGGALVWAALRPARRVLLVGGVAAFYLLHALVHVLDTVRGLFPPGQWLIDAVPIYLPTLALLGAVVALARRAPKPA